MNISEPILSFVQRERTDREKVVRWLLGYFRPVKDGADFTEYDLSEGHQKHLIKTLNRKGFNISLEIEGRKVILRDIK